MFIRSTTALAALFLLSAATSAQASDKPSDPQIAHIAYTAGVLDVEAAMQALKKSKNKEILDFAKDMVRDHEAVNKQALDLVKKLNVTPEDNATSKVAYHKQVNGALETLMIPSAENAKLKSLLETGLKLFQGHEQHAEHVAGMLK
ncbi:DUF4142 domain-containing protein [Mesorhizobium sp. L48C026A00]|uniref:DUF4142 domain-containing protein n=1 Tax=Mesorhizobium sp. L48C026A00 TaxID=1287182 RepID=UPI0003CFBAD8|nr:DUF4142 domain-containing protein [Mesorhizobium sp. L48C026A00]ESZ17830.1 membrane protein [Mesorhizobium sp. L48C026A00]